MGSTREKIKILYFTLDFTTHDYRFLTALGELQNHTIYFLRLENKNNSYETRKFPNNVKIIKWRGEFEKYQKKYFFNYLIDLNKIIKNLNPDFIHAGPIHQVSFKIAILFFKPLISMSWGSDILLDTKKSFINKLKSQFVLKRSSLLVADCKTVIRQAKILGFRKEFVIFPWGIDINRFRPQNNVNIKNILHWEKKFVILSTRSWEPLYGIHLLLKAFNDIIKTNLDIRLILIGSGSQKQQFEKYIKKNYLGDFIYIAGKINQKELPSYYNSANVYVSTSYSDGSSVSLLEALACECISLVSDIPSNREWIVNGNNGFLFKKGDYLDLKEKLLYIYERNNQLENVKKMARKKAVHSANWNKNKLKLQNIYL